MCVTVWECFVFVWLVCYILNIIIHSWKRGYNFVSQLAHLSTFLICASKITNNFEWFNPAKGQNIAINFNVDFHFIVLKHFIGPYILAIHGVCNAVTFDFCRHCQCHTMKTQFRKTSCFINDDHSICKIQKEGKNYGNTRTLTQYTQAHQKNRKRNAIFTIASK